MAENNLAQCRVCGEHIALFELLELSGIESQVEELIGRELVKGTYIPSSICRQCKSDFEIAREFKRKCIQTNEVYETKCDTKLSKYNVEKDIPSSPTFVLDIISKYKFDEQDDAQDNAVDPKFILPPEGQNDKNEHISKKSSSKLKKDECNKLKLKSRDSINRTQKEQVKLICDVCGNGFHAKHIFALHKRRHNNDKPYSCE